MMKDGLKYTAIYMDTANAYPHTIRLVAVQTDRFPHGLHIGIWRPTKEQAIEAAKEVDGYIDLLVAEALEKAAKLCDDLHHDWRFDDHPDSDSGPHRCAAAIRKLITVPTKEQNKND